MNRRSILLLLATLIAVVGTSLVFLYARGADSRAEKKFDTVVVLKAVQDIAAGESVEAAFSSGKLKEASVPAKERLTGALSSSEQIKGLVATVKIFSGEQIIADKFGGQAAAETLAIPKGMIAVSVELSDPGRVAGFVNPGSEVAIFHQQPEGAGGRTELMLKRVLVLGVGSTSTTTTTKSNDPNGQVTQEVPKTMLTIALSQEDAEKVLFTTSEEVDHGGIAFALLTDDSDTQYTRGTGWGNLKTL